MKYLLAYPLIAALSVALPISAPLSAQAESADGTYSKQVEGSFDDVSFAVEQAIINEGLVIDLRSHVGDMLTRTKEDVGGEADLFTHADVFSFCSATLSRQVMEEDVTNIQYCPYGIFVYETPDAPGQVTVGHRIYSAETMGPVNDLLTQLVDAATE